MSTTYRGYPGGRVEVVTDGVSRPLDPRNDLVNHSPDGFQWGYHGSGPAQLALAMMAHSVGDRRALVQYHDFKSKVIASLSIDEGFTIDRDFVESFSRSHERANSHMTWTEVDIEH